MSSQSRMINNFINCIMFVLILIHLIKSSSCDSELANLTKISEKRLSTSSSILSSIKTWFNGLSESNYVSESRTFGHIRRLQMALLPILFKFGILSAMIAVLVFLALKTVFLLKALLILNLGALLIKLVGWKYEHQLPQPILYGYSPHPVTSWSPHQHQFHGWEKPHQDNKEVHLHIHNDGKSPEIYHSHDWNRNSDNQPYNGYSSRTNKHHINEDYENYGPITVSKSYRNVERGNHV